MKTKAFHGECKALTFLSILSMMALAVADNTSPGGLQSGDLVGICGDSITEQKLYSVYIADYLLMCQPQSKLSAIQFGWSGEQAPGFLARMKNDALVFKPTVVTTCYGMNDGGYAATTPERLDTYRKSMTGIVDTCKANGVRFIVVGTPGAVDTFYFQGCGATVYNKTLADLSQVAKEVAQQEGVGFADLHDTMIDVMARAKAQNGDNFCVCGPEGIHPPPDGHVIMAYAFLKALGCDGAIGTITVDMQSNQAEATDGTKVISDTNGTVALESTRYPFCFAGANVRDPNSTRSILPFLPFNQDLNRYMLVVKNAPAKSLKVTWGARNKTFSSDDLVKGVNIAAEFPDNPFNGPFLAVQLKIAAQQAFETMASKGLLHSLLGWNAIAGAQDVLNPVIPELSGRIVAQWQALRDASAAAVMPVKHEIKIEAMN